MATATTDTLPAISPELMIWLSPAFPVGAFAYSHGLEQAVAEGWVAGCADLEGWLAALAETGSLRNDMILLAEAWHATQAGDAGRYAACNETALALAPSAERHLESVTQGKAFAAAIHASWPHERLDQALGTVEDHAYPVILGAAAAAHGVDLRATLFAHGLAFVSNLVSAAIRLSVIGQTDGQRVIAGMMPALEAAANVAQNASLDDLGSAVFRADLASLAHETLYSRLFRS